MSPMRTSTHFESGRPVPITQPEIGRAPSVRATDYRRAAIRSMAHIVGLIQWLNDQPDSEVAILAAAIAHGHVGVIGGRSMSDIADALGVSRDTISRQAGSCCRALGLQPSHYMRGVSQFWKPEKNDEQGDENAG